MEVLVAHGGEVEHVTRSVDKQRKQASPGHIACLSLWLFPSVHLDLGPRKHLHLKRSFVSREHFHVHDFFPRRITYPIPLSPAFLRCGGATRFQSGFYVSSVTLLGQRSLEQLS